MVGAGDLAGRYFERLSDGEKQKIILARALAQEPRLILLDEPTVHLDLKHRLEVMSILRSLCREMNVAVVASLHDIDVASRVSDQVALISGGGLEAFGPPEVILDDLCGF
jgi:iron complex transport system ATP-binding protein